MLNIEKLKLAFVFVVACLCSCSKIDNSTHVCKWKLCPYKGIEQSQYKQAVVDYSQCEEGTDCYYIDLLHLKYPDADYDSLEDMLFNLPSVK